MRFIKTKIIRPAVEAREKKIDSIPGKRGRTCRLKLAAENFESTPPAGTPEWMVSSAWISRNSRLLHLIEKPRASESPQYDRLNQYCSEHGYVEVDEEAEYEERLRFRRHPYRKWEEVKAEKEARKVKLEPEASLKGAAEATVVTGHAMTAPPIHSPAIPISSTPIATMAPNPQHTESSAGYFHSPWPMSTVPPPPHYGYPQYGSTAPTLASPATSSPTHMYSALYANRLPFPGQSPQPFAGFPLQQYGLHPSTSGDPTTLDHAS